MGKKKLNIILYSFLISLGSFVSVLIIRWRQKEIPFLLLVFCLFMLIMLVISIRKGKRLSVKIGFIFAIVHFLVFMRDLMQVCEGGAFYTLLSDIFLVPVYAFIKNFIDSYLATIIVFGILGTVCWSFIPLGIARLVEKFTRPKVRSEFR